jgi:hypothetical protein
MPKPGWMAQCNAEVLRWASDYEQWRAKAMQSGEFPAVVRTGKPSRSEPAKEAPPANSFSERAVPKQ